MYYRSDNPEEDAQRYLSEPKQQFSYELNLKPKKQNGRKQNNRPAKEASSAAKGNTGA